MKDSDELRKEVEAFVARYSELVDDDRMRIELNNLLESAVQAHYQPQAAGDEAKMRERLALIMWSGLKYYPERRIWELTDDDISSIMNKVLPYMQPQAVKHLKQDSQVTICGHWYEQEKLELVEIVEDATCDKCIEFATWSERHSNRKAAP